MDKLVNVEFESSLQYDPALKEFLLRKTGSPRGEGAAPEVAAERIPVIARLRDPLLPVPAIEVVAQFGPIVTGRVTLDRIVEARLDANVLSLKASQVHRPALVHSVSEIGATPELLRQSVPGGVTGRGVVIGVIDWGCDFAHANFRHPSGATRLLALWDQRGGARPDSPTPFGYGREFNSARIDAALGQPDPYSALGYDPSDTDLDGTGSHGTHVLDIAAGNGSAPGSSAGIAPGADLMFVHLKADDTHPEDTLGDSARVLEAARYIFDRAGDRPVALNLSLGRTGGPHDGSPLVVQGLDALLAEQPGRAICMSTGNYYESGLHAGGRLASGATIDIGWVVPPRVIDAAELEIWYPGRDSLAVELIDPAGTTVAQAGLGQDLLLRDGPNGPIAATIYHRRHDPNNNDNQINLFLWPNAPAGIWTVRLAGLAVEDGAYHAWIERDDPAVQSRFTPDSATPGTTTGSICNGQLTIAVGAYDARQPGTPPVAVSSAGPTRDGRDKPDISAPGGAILAARSASRPDVLGRRLLDGLSAKSGTSMAAPHATGVVALMHEAAAPGRLTAAGIRDILLRTARGQPPFTTDDRLRYGAGRIDAGAAIRLARARAADHGYEATAELKIDREEAGMSYPIAPTIEPSTNDLASANGQSGDAWPDSVIQDEPANPDVVFAWPIAATADELTEALADIVVEGDDAEQAAEEARGRLANLLPAHLVEAGDRELRQRDEHDIPLYDKRQPLHFAPTGERYRLGDGQYSYQAPNFVYNTAYSLGYDVPVYPPASQATSGRSYNTTSATFDVLANGQATNEAGDRAYFSRFFETVASPGDPAPADIRAGDVLLRGSPRTAGANGSNGNGVGHMAIVADPTLRPMDDPYFLDRDAAEGHGLHCIEAGLAIHPLADRHARVLTGPDGRLLPDRMLLRFRESAIDVPRATEQVLEDAIVPEQTEQVPPPVVAARPMAFLPVSEFVSVPVTVETMVPGVAGAPTTLPSRSFSTLAALSPYLAVRDTTTPSIALELPVGHVARDYFLRPNPARPAEFQIPLDMLICYPANPANTNQLAALPAKFPVVLIVHGNHDAWIVNWIPDPAVPNRIEGGRTIVRRRFDVVQSTVANHEGYRYLQEELALQGIVSVSINDNPSNFFNSYIRMRADTVMAALALMKKYNGTVGSRFHNRLDFKRVGLMGHSRGGDAVVKAVELNGLPRGPKHGIKAVVLLAPTDFSGTLADVEQLRLTGSDKRLLVVYGSHDADVNGVDGGRSFTGSGFRHFDRATCPRTMLFIHGGTHNRFNTVWGTKDPAHTAADLADPRLISDADHRELAKEYIGGFMRLVLKGETGLTDLFNGVRQNARHATVSTQWLFGNPVLVVDDFSDVTPTHNAIGGLVSPPAYTSEVALATQGAAFTHQERVLFANVKAGITGVYRSELPLMRRDLNAYSALTFRLTKRYNLTSAATISVDPFPAFSIRLEDGQRRTATFDQVAIYASNPLAPTRPYFRTIGASPATKNTLETIRVPLALFRMPFPLVPRVDLADIRVIDLVFNPASPADIYIDTIALVNA